MSAIAEFFRLWGEAFDKGTGIYFVLWVVILCLMFVIWNMLRGYNKRLAHCEEQHADQTRINGVLRNKLSISIGMMAAALGDRAPPQGFWAALMNDDITDVPAWTVGSPLYQRREQRSPQQA